MSELYNEQNNNGNYSNVPDKTNEQPVVIGKDTQNDAAPQNVQNTQNIQNPQNAQNQQNQQNPQGIQNTPVNQPSAQPQNQYYGAQYNTGYTQTPQNQNNYNNYAGGSGMPYNNPYSAYQVQQTKQPVKTRKKVDGRGTVIAVSVICALTVVLSAFAGIGGAMLVRGDGDSASGNGTTEATPSSSYTSDDAGFIYKSINTVPESTDGKTTVADVAGAVKDSVVEITTEYKSTGYFQYVTQGAGSGVIITSDGYIVTNNHVISDSSTGGVADTITVRLTDGTEYDATVVGTDSSSDVALLKIEAANLIPAIFGDSDKLAVGEEVVAVGNPLGELGGTVTNGIISALDRAIEVDGTTMNLLQTNAAVNPGNSGGGLFNMAGELVGIVNAKSSGTGIEGLGFAIPSNDASSIIEQLREYGYVRGRVYLGISFLDVTDYMTATYYRVNSLGVYVIRAEEGYNDSVLKSGDRITAVDGTEVSLTSDIKNILTSHSVGDELVFSIAREGKIMDVTVKCYESVPDTATIVDFN